MVETMVGIVIVFGTLFVVCKVLGMIARVCGLTEVMETLGESLAVGSGDFSSNRKN